MTDPTTTTSPLDAAIAVIMDRARELETEIVGHQRCIEVATASRNELLDLIATLGRKPRARKPRMVTENGNQTEEPTRSVGAGRAPESSTVDAAPALSVFGALPPHAANDAAA
jgi:hypothetical protein